MNICLTGSSGFVGSHVLSALSSSYPNATFSLLCRSLPSHTPPRATVIQSNIENLDTEVLQSLPHFDFLVHCATSRSHRLGVDAIDDLLFTNLVGPTRLAMFMAQRGTAIINLSTSSVYGDLSHRQTLSEKSQSVYSITKLSFDLLLPKIAERFNTSFATIRLVAPYGPGLRDRLLYDIPLRIIDSRPIILPSPSSVGMSLNPIHIDHITAIICHLVQLPGSWHYTLQGGGERIYSLKEYADECAQLLGIDPIYAFSPTAKDLNLCVSPLSLDLHAHGIDLCLPPVLEPHKCLTAEF